MASACITAAHSAIIDVLQDNDAPPTAIMLQTAKERLAVYAALKQRWLAVAR